MYTEEELQEIEEKYQSMEEELEAAAERHSFKNYGNCYITKFLNDDAPVVRVYVKIATPINRFDYEVGYSISRLPSSEYEKVGRKCFETTEEAICFIEDRANRINEFFENL